MKIYGAWASSLISLGHRLIKFFRLFLGGHQPAVSRSVSIVRWRAIDREESRLGFIAPRGIVRVSICTASGAFFASHTGLIPRDTWALIGLRCDDVFNDEVGPALIRLDSREIGVTAWSHYTDICQLLAAQWRLVSLHRSRRCRWFRMRFDEQILLNFTSCATHDKGISSVSLDKEPELSRIYFDLTVRPSFAIQITCDFQGDVLISRRPSPWK